MVELLYQQPADFLLLHHHHHHHDPIPVCVCVCIWNKITFWILIILHIFPTYFSVSSSSFVFCCEMCHHHVISNYSVCVCCCFVKDKFLKYMCKCAHTHAYNDGCILQVMIRRNVLQALSIAFLDTWWWLLLSMKLPCTIPSCHQSMTAIELDL